MKFNFEQFKDNFYEKLESKKREKAIAFFDHCTDDKFETEKELIELKRFKEACDISKSTFDEIVSTTEEV